MSRFRAILEPSDWAGSSLVSASQCNRNSISFLWEVADSMRRIVEKRGGCNLLQHRVLAAAFFEPSTRTSGSFQAAFQRLGGTVLSISESGSSTVKGETLEDTVRTLECYADAIVMRHHIKGAAQRAAAAVNVPFINAGDGVGEHPTQALLDLFTIKSELGKVDDLTVTMVGDLKNGRTVHSLAKSLIHFRVKINFVCPEELGMPDEILTLLSDHGISHNTYRQLDSVLSDTDVLYVTRVQKERFASPEEYERLKHAFVITPETLVSCKERMIVMHPLPRVGEITEAVDSDPRAAYFRQMRYGLFLRMALLALMLGCSREDVDAIAT